MKISGVMIHTILIGSLAALQSVVFRHGIVAGVTPDFALIVLIFTANQFGSLKSQTAGFASGLIQDFLSITPLGFHAFSRALLGYLYGLFRGKLFIDPILVPVLLAAFGTLLKAVFGYVLLAAFSPAHASVVFSMQLAIEIGLNALVAPFLYGLLKVVGIVKMSREEL
jgi:rod shape-determining protein MreD